MRVEPFFDEHSGTLTYVVDDGRTGVVIDPVRDFDLSWGRTSWRSAEKIAAYIDSERLQIRYVIDTHAHADHFSGIPFFRERYGAQSVTGVRIAEVQERLGTVLDLGGDSAAAGSPFDVLLDEGKLLRFGQLEIEAMHTPGHTPEHMSWRIQESVFVGDTLLMPDCGSARCDFPGGSADQLFHSIQRLYRLADDTRLYVGHDARPGGRPLAFQTTVAEQKGRNVHIRPSTTESDFLALRNEADARSPGSPLLLLAPQVNLRAGEFPEPAANGTRYLKLPIDAL